MKKVFTVFLALLLILSMLPAGGALYAEDEGGGMGGGGISSEVGNITGIEIINQPKLFYYVGESLHLGPFDDADCLFVKLKFDNGEPVVVGFNQFEDWGITTDPANGTVLTADHDGQNIKVIVNGLEVHTDPLIVSSVQEGVELDPETAIFDKNPANQKDVKIEVKWLGNALELIRINYGEYYFVSDEHYDFSQDDSNGKYYLTLKKELLDLLPVGQETFTLKFSRYVSAELKVNIIDTGDAAPPSWPAGSSLTANSITSESVSLSWSAALDDIAVTEYRIYQDQDVTPIMTVAGNVTTCEITGLAAETEYTFRVEAGDGENQWTTDGPTVKVTTLPPPNNPPTWPAGSSLKASGTTHNTVTLSWDQAQDDVLVTGYRVYQNEELIVTLGPVTTYEVTGLLPATTYSFQVQAGDGNNQWTTDGPSLTVTTNPEVVPEMKSLSLKAPRYTLEGHLFMEDTVSIEMVSNQSGLSPEVTVSYKKWNVDGTATEDKTSTLTLTEKPTETPSDSIKYAANFTLSEGICQVTALTGKLKPDSSPYKINMNNRVAGRIKLTVQAPAGLDSEQIELYNAFLQGTSASASKTNSWVSFTSETKDLEKPNEFTIEGVSGNDNFQAATYELEHYKEFLIYEHAETVSVKDGQESVCQYSIDSFSHLKVRVVDEATGEPIANALVRSPLLMYVNGTRDYNLSARTDNDGYAATSASYFAQNLRRDAELELIVSASEYENKVVKKEAGSLAVGENSIDIFLKKVPIAIVTLQGTVRDSKGVPVKQAFVRVPQTAPDGTDISVATLTDEEGFYTLQVPQTVKTVSFSKFGTNIDESLALQEGINLLNVTFPPLTAKVRVLPEVKDFYNNTIQLGFTMDLLNISVKNESKNYAEGELVSGYYNIDGEPGDKIQVSAEVISGGYGVASATVCLDENNYAEARLVLTQLEQQQKIKVNIIDRFGNSWLGEPRYMYLFDDNDRLVNWVSSTAPGISYPVLQGGFYRAVFSWEGVIWSDNLAGWENRPDCLISKIFEVKEGQVVDLGTRSVHYTVADPYFRQNMATAVTSPQRAAIPGSVVTLRVGYDYDNLKAIDGNKLDLVAQIPADATLVEGSVLHRSTRGNADSVQPVISENKDRITLDLKNHIPGAAGVLTYQIRIKSPAVYNSISACAELKFMVGGRSVSENIGFIEIPCKIITLNAPLEISEAAKADPVRLSGLAPANKTVEIYDGYLKIGETQAAQSGAWAISVTLPDRGTPIYHQLTAGTVVDNIPYTASAAVLVGRKGAEMTEFVMRQGPISVKIVPRNNNIEFPFVTIPNWGDLVVNTAFINNDKVSNVKIAGVDAILQNGVFQARVPSFTPVIMVEYDEVTTEPEEILKYDFGIVPDYLREAEVEFTDSNHTSADTHVGYGSDGYLSEFVLPEIKISPKGKDGYGTVSMRVETAPFDPANAQNRTHLGNGMYGYDFSAELVNGKYVITGYLDRGLLPQQAFEGADRQSRMRTMAVAAGLEFVKSTIEVAGNVDELTGAFGDLSKSAKMAQLLNDYESIRPNLEPHLQEYYDRRISMMGEDILMGKSLGFVQDGVAEAANLVPLAGQVVCGIAKYISGKLLGDMFDSEFESDYNILRSEFNNLPGSQNWYDRQTWSTYDPQTGLYRIPHSLKARPHYIYDPSGFVYEAVEDNRISGVTATALFLPKEKAATAAEAKASTEWQVWNAGWYLQENPQTTDVEGKYAWDVPEGWWMVQFVKDGYQTAYSDALPVPPPQVDINIAMVKLVKPAVDKVIWGSGGRYIDIYFTKYMDTRTLEAASAFRLTDADGNPLTDDDGNPVTGTVSYPEGVKTGVDGSGKSGLTLTKAARFTPSVPLTAGASYTLTVNRAVADYAGFSLTADYVETGIVSAAEAFIANISGTDITVEPGLDITQDLANALTFTAVNPSDENLLDTRAVFISSNPNVVSITPDGKATSLAEGTAQITVTSVDDPTKNAVFTVTVAYPPSPVRVSHMAILGSDGRALTKLNLLQGSTYDLNPIISPADAANKAMSYYSDNPAVATVDAGGKIRAIAKGIAIITAKTVDKNIRQMIHVRVSDAAPPASNGSGGGGGVALPGEKEISSQRLAGADRYATAAAISARGWQTSDDVILASGENFPDALAGTALAGVKDAPVLLTGKETLNSETLAEIKRLKAQTIYLLGGLGVISPSVEKTLAKDYKVIRLAGGDRYETAARIGELLGTSVFETAVVTTGTNYPDALSIAAFAGQYGLPILFTEKEELNAFTAQALKRWQVQNVILVGGSGVITAHVENIFRNEMKLNVTRLSGADRYLTGLEIAKHFASYSAASGSTGDSATYPDAALATGDNYPDALAGAALAAKLKMPILLTGKERVSPEIKAYLQELNPEKLYVFGGRAVITEQVLAEINKKN
jgi:putative cell wall-binding protein/chitodextrinase